MEKLQSWTRLYTSILSTLAGAVHHQHCARLRVSLCKLRLPFRIGGVVLLACSVPVSLGLQQQISCRRVTLQSYPSTLVHLFCCAVLAETISSRRASNKFDVLPMFAIPLPSASSRVLLDFSPSHRYLQALQLHGTRDGVTFIDEARETCQMVRSLGFDAEWIEVGASPLAFESPIREPHSKRQLEHASSSTREAHKPPKSQQNLTTSFLGGRRP